MEALYRRCHLTTVQLVSVYYGMPSYTAYSGSQDSGSPSQTLASDGCNSGSALVGDDLENIKSGPVPLVERLDHAVRANVLQRR